MKRIFKANWLINTCDLRQQKYARIILSVIVLIILLMFEGFRLLLKKHVNFHVNECNIIYIFIAMSELLFFPMQIYKQILFRKDEIMLYMAGLERKKIYMYYFLKNVIISNIVVFIICRNFLESIIVEWGTMNTIVVLAVTFVVFGEILLFELCLKSIIKKDIYKEIAIIVSIEEIIASISLYSHINNVNFKDCSFSLTGSKAVLCVIMLEILYVVKVIRYFRKSKQVSFYKKNWLLIIRDFDSLKYIVASIMLYVIPIAISKNRPDFSSITLVTIFFIINIMIVLGINNFRLERAHYVTYYLAMFNEKKYIKEKMKFFFEVCLLATFCLNTALIVTQNLKVREIVIIYSVTFLFCKSNAVLTAKAINRLLKYYKKNYHKLKKWKEIFDEK